jgi:hypothetical protein
MVLDGHNISGFCRLQIASLSMGFSDGIVDRFAEIPFSRRFRSPAVLESSYPLK